MLLSPEFYIFNAKLFATKTPKFTTFDIIAENCNNGIEVNGSQP